MTVTGAVGAAVVDDHDLVRDAGVGEDLGDLGDELGQVLGLVVRRQQHRQVGGQGGDVSSRTLVGALTGSERLRDPSRVVEAPAGPRTDGPDGGRTTIAAHVPEPVRSRSPDPADRPMRALVTGAGGFVGRHLVRHLSECGDDVVTTDPTHGGADITDADAVAAEVAEVGPEVVYHLAGWADVGGSWTRPRSSRVPGQRRGHPQRPGRGRATPGCERVVAVSSADVYGTGRARGDAPHRGEPRSARRAPTRRRRSRPTTWASRPGSATGCRCCGCGPSTTSARARPTSSWPRPWPAASPGPSATAARSSPSATSPPAATTPTCATWCGPTASSPSTASRARPTTCAPASTWRCRTSATSSWPGSTSPLRFETDPELLRPVDTPVLRGSHDKLTAATGWEPEIPIEQTLADLLDDWRERLAAEG